ncbi:hypothetical protein IAT38_002871 [Cryptococcus sp. DSM 104549]
MWALHKISEGVAKRKKAGGTGAMVAREEDEDGGGGGSSAGRVAKKRRRTDVTASSSTPLHARSGTAIDSLNPERPRDNDPEAPVSAAQHDAEEDELSSETRRRSMEEKEEDGGQDGEERGVPPWGFSDAEVERWPALRKRNYWCIQRHSATALHYDLRMQLDGTTFSWAVPKGLIGISKSGEARRMAVETTLHTIDYTTHEGSDGRLFSGGRRGGTLLWDIGEYIITKPPTYQPDTDEEEEAERRRYHPRRGDSDRDGSLQEALFREAMQRQVGYGKTRSIHFTLRGGKKMTNHSYILLLPPSHISTSYSTTGVTKKTWFISLPRDVDGYPWDRGGEDGEFWGRSVKSGLSFQQVCAGMGDDDAGSLGAGDTLA